MAEGNEGTQSNGGQQSDNGGASPTDTQSRQSAVPSGYIPASERDSAAAAARREGEGAGYKAAAEELGVSIEDAKRIVADAKQREEDQKSELDRERDTREQAEKAKNQAESDSQEAISKASAWIVRAEARAQAAALGIKAERLDYVVKLADLGSIEVKDGEPDSEAAKAAIEAVLKDVPEFAAPFEEQQRQQRRAPDANNRPKQDGNLRGADRLRAMNW
jgi:hypothetical protein